MCDAGYAGLQQPSDGYSNVKQSGGGYGSSPNPSGGYSDAKQSGGGYSSSQNPSDSYASARSTVSAGLGNGVNLQPSYYPLESKETGDVDLGWKWMRQFDTEGLIKSVRIEIDPLHGVANLANAQRWINEAVANGYAPIATYHIDTQYMQHTAVELLEAANWWVTNYRYLARNAALTINLINEWGDKGITAEDFADTYNKAIAMVRSTYGGPIIVDAPGFGQALQTAALAIKGAQITIKDPQIIMSAHIYNDAWNPSTGKGLQRSDLDTLAATGVACMVGEFGEKKTGGNTPNWADLVDYAKSNNWPVFGWAWNGDATPLNAEDLGKVLTTPPAEMPMALAVQLGKAMNMISPLFQARVKEPQKYDQTEYFKTIYAHL